METQPAARPPFDPHLSSRLDWVITQLDAQPATIRRAWLRLVKFWYEIDVPAFYVPEVSR